MGNPSRSRDRAVDASVDLVAVQHSVEALMAGIGPAGPGFSVRPLSAGLAELISAATQILGVDRIGVMLLDEHDHLRSCGRLRLAGGGNRRLAGAHWDRAGGGHRPER